MKICDNGIIRDMTEEEIAELDRERSSLPNPADYEEEQDKAEAYDILTGVSE